MPELANQREKPTQHFLLCPELGCGGTLILKFSPKFNRWFYGCERWAETGCKGGIGAHPDGRPLGVPATPEVKKFRIQAHAYFDALWDRDARHELGMSHESPVLMRRKAAYRWLQKSMGMTKTQAHIGNFGQEECERLIHFCKVYLGIEQ